MDSFPIRITDEAWFKDFILTVDREKIINSVPAVKITNI